MRWIRFRGGVSAPGVRTRGRTTRPHLETNIGTGTDSNGALRKDLGVRDVFAIATGAMISSGLFVLPGVLYEMTGPWVWLAYILAAVLVVPALCCKAELATAMPKAGGTYYFIDRAMGPAMGTLGGFAAWLSLALKTAFALFGVGAFCLVVDPSFTSWQVKTVAVLVTLAATWLNIVGVKSAARLQSTLVSGLLLALVGYVALAAPHVDMANFQQPLTGGLNGLALATGSAFVAFGGLTKAAALAEEVYDPGRVLPRAMFLAFGIVTLLYVTVVASTVGVLGDSMAGDLNPVVHGAERIIGRPGLIVISIAALTAYITTGNAGIMASSRMPMAMSRDMLLPPSLSEVNRRYGTPVVSIGLTAVLLVGSIIFLDLETLVKTASVMKILLFLLVNVAVILMRESRVEFYRPTWKVPLYPVMPAFGIVTYAVLCAKLGLQPLLLAMGFLGIGLLWYASYARIRVNRQSAVSHWVGRLNEEDLDTTDGLHTLEAELRAVLREREGVELDKFDRLIERALVLDLGRTDLHGMATAVGDALGPKVGQASETIAELIEDHEREISSIIMPGLAIPVISLPFDGHVEVVAVRSREGIEWWNDEGLVNAVFIVAASDDHKHLRLQLLALIAQVAHGNQFARQWMSVRDKDSLREVLVLARRRRLHRGSMFLLGGQGGRQGGRGQGGRGQGGRGQAR